MQDDSKVINVTSTTEAVKHNTMKKLSYEFRFLLKIWFGEKGDFIKNDDLTICSSSNEINFGNLKYLLKLIADKLCKKFLSVMNTRIAYLH